MSAMLGSTPSGSRASPTAAAAYAMKGYDPGRAPTRPAGVRGRGRVMTRATVTARLRQRLDAVEARLAAACRRAGRARADVPLVAVTKTVGPEVAALLPDVALIPP